MDQKSATAGPDAPAQLLLVEDDPHTLIIYTRFLESFGHRVYQATNGRQALETLKTQHIDVVVSDIAMPELDGIGLLKALSELRMGVPVVLLTGGATVESAMEAVEFGALRYLTKPVRAEVLKEVVGKAVAVRRASAPVRRPPTAELKAATRAVDDNALDEAIRLLWMAFQPIVDLPSKRVFAFEGLVRSKSLALPHPGKLLAAAESLGRVHELSRAIREAIARDLVSEPKDSLIFINLHPLDLNDETLYSPESALSAHAARVVLELTERDTLAEVKDVPARLKALRKLGFRLAIDDLGAGFSGLSHVALLSPDVIKLDMSLIQGIHQSTTQQRLVAHMAQMSREVNARLVCEGVETQEERLALEALSCDLMQGYLFGRPSAGFVPPIYE
jgi:EAL domain-containing protein (putative c-di-GMP-specific phosphodiesterase class I)